MYPVTPMVPGYIPGYLQSKYSTEFTLVRLHPVKLVGKPCIRLTPWRHEQSTANTETERDGRLTRDKNIFKNL